MLNALLNNYFGFNRQQRNGLLVLVIISFVLLILRLVYPVFIQPDPIIIENLPLIEREIDSASAKDSSRSNFNYKEKQLNLFVFNPNTVNLEQLIKLGFKENTAKRFLKFRAKGFVFKNKTDLKKVYGISEGFYQKLEQYVFINETKEEKTIEEKTKISEEIRNVVATKEKSTAQIIELNSADSITLISVNGIGPSYAKRILKYRSVLGGFVSKTQLLEVYGFTEELYSKTSSSFNVNPALIKKININQDDFKTINKHPYISYELCKSVFDWRRKTTVNAVNMKGIVNNEELYQKLMPYLSFD